MGVRTMVKDALQRLAGVEAAVGDATKGDRKTARLPSIFSPYYPTGRPGQNALPKPTAANLRKFAETPVVRRAINVVKDKIASMDWQVRVRRGYAGVAVEDAQERMKVLRQCLEEPNASDSFRVLWEQVLEDLLLSASRAAAVSGTYVAVNSANVWPGDVRVLSLQTCR